MSHMFAGRRRSRVDSVSQRALLEHVVAGTPARAAAVLVGVNRHTATLSYHRLREVVGARLAAEAPDLSAEVEADESYFGGVRKGKRGRGATGNVPVFGIIRQTVGPDSIIYNDAYRSFNILDVTEFRHHGINHGETFVAEGRHVKKFRLSYGITTSSVPGETPAPAQKVM